jgi:hypothetical protein
MPVSFLSATQRERYGRYPDTHLLFQLVVIELADARKVWVRPDGAGVPMGDCGQAWRQFSASYPGNSSQPDRAR